MGMPTSKPWNFSMKPNNWIEKKRKNVRREYSKNSADIHALMQHNHKSLHIIHANYKLRVADTQKWQQLAEQNQVMLKISIIGPFLYYRKYVICIFRTNQQTSLNPLNPSSTYLFFFTPPAIQSMPEKSGISLLGGTCGSLHLTLLGLFTTINNRSNNQRTNNAVKLKILQA